MLSSEERSGLVFTIVGGLVLVVVLLYALGLFSDSTSAPRGSAGAPAHAASLPALKLGSARGRVVDARSGFGLAGRSIEVRGLAGLSDHWIADADAEKPGLFEVRGLPAARRCTLALSADGYVEATRELDVVAGRTAELGDVALVPLATIRGQVVDASGAGLGPAHVEATSSAGARAQIESDAQGSFRFERLRPDRWTLRASTDAGEEPLAAMEVDATAGGEQRGLQLELFPTVALRGSFKLPVGSAPLSGVSAEGRSGRVSGDGRFEVTGLRAGPVRVIARVDAEHGVALDLQAPFDGAVLPIDPAAATAIEALAADATANAELAPIDAEPGGRAALVLRAVDAGGQRLVGARVDLAPTSSATTTRARLRFTSRAGECVVRGLPPASEWSIRARYGELEATAVARIEGEATSELVLTLAAPVPPPAPAPAREVR